MTSENPTNPQTPTAPQAHENPPNKADDPKSAPLPTVRKEVQVPPSHYCHKITYEKKRDGWDRAKMTAEFVGIIFLIIYTLYTCGIYKSNKKAAKAAHDTLGEIQQQTTLLRQQLIGSQAAVVVVNGPPNIEAAQIKYYAFNIGFKNEGHVIADKGKVKLMLQREIVSSAKPIGEPWTCDFDLLPIVPGKPVDHQCSLKGLNERMWQPIGEFKETIAVSGSISYWNGFEDAPPSLFAFVMQESSRVSLGMTVLADLRPATGIPDGLNTSKRE